MTATGSRPLPPAEAYRLWAPQYDAENAVTWLEDVAARELTPPLGGARLLDAGCGTARRLRWAAGVAAEAPRGFATPEIVARSGVVADVVGREGLVTADVESGAPPARLVGVDLVPAMLTASRNESGLRTAIAGRPRIELAAGDVLALPLAAARFDVVWCRLVLGHVPPEDLSRAYAELARVATPGATLVVTDFHPAAVAAGHRRTFRDAAGSVHEVRHHVHAPEGHERAARPAGWRLERRLEPGVGPEVRGYYERAGRLDRYQTDLGLPLVLALAFTLAGGPAADAGVDRGPGGAERPDVA